jgi:hypothetical protein
MLSQSRNHKFREAVNVAVCISLCSHSEQNETAWEASSQAACVVEMRES